jgi:hypothetical protein
MSHQESHLYERIFLVNGKKGHNQPQFLSKEWGPLHLLKLQMSECQV